MGGALHLYPVAILVVVTAGTMLSGVPRALLAVPAGATTYRVTEYLREHPASSAGGAAGAHPTAEVRYVGPPEDGGR
jgi:predicted PurR-regulated permease PerM